MISWIDTVEDSRRETEFLLGGPARPIGRLLRRDGVTVGDGLQGEAIEE